jgi:type I restriction enzyme S subunit
MIDELPQGWTTAPLREVVAARKGKKPKVLHEIAAPDRVPYLLIDQMEGKPARYFTDDPKVTVASKDDVLVVWDGSIGKCAAGLEGAVGSTIVALKPVGVESGFLEAFIKHARRTLLETSRGTGLQHINQEVFWELEFPLAPFAEQQRILVKLEKLLDKVDDCQQRLAKIPLLLKRFRQSVLDAACSGRVTVDWRQNQQAPHAVGEGYRALRSKLIFNLDDGFGTASLPETWEYVPIGNLSGFQQGMQIAKATRLKESGSNRLPILRIGNYANAFSEDVDYVEVNEESLIAEPDDIILTRTGETRGKVLTGFRGVFHNNTFRMNYEKRLILREYLIAWLNTAGVQEFIRQRSGRSAQPDLTHKAFGPCPFPLAPLAEQKEIVRRVEELFALADQIEARYAKGKAHVDKLTQSILAKAFRGELVPQDPNDEPASVLLERIRARREQKSRLNCDGKIASRRKS